MFWKLSFRQPSAIDSLLDKEECSLSEILDEDDVLQECKTQNKKLIEFLVRPENMEQLVRLVTEEPTDSTDEKAKYKYPHIACELLTAEVFSIVEQLSTTDDLLARLWNFLDAKEPLNPLLGSFISKVLTMLLTQRTSVVLEYIQKRSGFLDAFLSHLGTSALMDLLLQMVSGPDGDQLRLDLAQWLRDEGIVEKLVNYIDSSASQEQCVNASQALCDMLRIAREISGPSPLLSALESEETLEHLIKNMFSCADPPDCVIINGINFLLTFLERRSAGAFTPTFNRTFTSQPDEPTSVDHQQAMDRIVSVVSPQLGKFHDLLHRKPKMEVMLTTAGSLNPPLGFMRLQVVKLFSAFLHTGDSCVHRQIIVLKTLDVLLNMFFEYPWNNFLHMQVELCISTSLVSCTNVAVEVNCESGEAERSITLRHHLLSECQVVQRLLDGAKNNEQLMSQGKGRLGYMGHLTRMANNVAGNRTVGTLNRTREESTEEAPADTNLTNALDEDTLQRWHEFTAGPLAEINKKNNTNLGGNRPLTSSFEDSDEDFDQLNMGPDNELEKAFQQYQDCKFASNLVEEFGLNDNLSMATVPFSSTYTDTTNISCSIDADEEHTQSMSGFEAACTERIQPFDDSESDEEESTTWVEKDMSLATPDQQSFSSEEDEEEGTGRQREFTTGSSDDEESSLSDRRFKLTSGGKRQDGDIGVIAWRSEFSTDEDLSGVSRGSDSHWTKNPSNSNKEDWADFSTFSTTFGKPADSGEAVSSATPSKVTVTYVSVREDDDDDEVPPAQPTTHSRLSSGGSDEDGIVLDHALINMNIQDTHSSSDEEDGNSSDEEKSGSYSFSSEDGNPLLNASSQSNTSAKSDSDSTPDLSSPLRQQSDSDSHNSERHTADNERTQNTSDGVDKELGDNYSYLSKQGLLSSSHTDKNVELARAAAVKAQLEYEKEVAATAAMSENSTHS